ncbi:hypothetical protein [Amycolatopsis albispora]|uniref:Uncharacterized protein n=1 Tax=Amycolatopsis albispora TaxID=1804986 RepID=A0A344L9R6_9PSEU|nr:hypothetical protein [Amycolatopsis albispora]AXB44790.1 hypothetical protein A4R43_21695 [Amycolatopsis albispora]
MSFNLASFVPRQRTHTPRVIAVRLRAGTTLSSGRTCGETDREVHYIPTPEAVNTTGTTTALCETVLHRGDLEFVEGHRGVPCTSCFLRYLNPLTSVQVPRQRNGRVW